MRKPILYSTILTVILLGGAALAEEVDFAKLETEGWNYAKDKKWDELKARFAPGYQYVDQHKAVGLKEALEALTKMNLSDFTLSDFKVTESGSTAVITYMVNIAETIDGKRIQRQAAPRASVWGKTNKGWLTILHANLNPLGK